MQDAQCARAGTGSQRMRQVSEHLYKLVATAQLAGEPDRRGSSLADAFTLN